MAPTTDRPSGTSLGKQLERLLPSALSSIGMAGLVNARRLDPSVPDTTVPSRSTQERLDSYLRQDPEALTPRSLRKVLTDLQAIVDTRVSEVEGVRKADPFVSWYHQASPEARADA